MEEIFDSKKFLKDFEVGKYFPYYSTRFGFRRKVILFGKEFWDEDNLFLSLMIEMRKIGKHGKIGIKIPGKENLELSLCLCGAAWPDSGGFLFPTQRLLDICDNFIKALEGQKLLGNLSGKTQEKAAPFLFLLK